VSKTEIRGIMLKVLVLFMLIACLALFSTGASRRLILSRAAIAEPQQPPGKSNPQSNARPQDSAPPTMSDFLNQSSKHSGQPPIADFGKSPGESQEAHERRRLRENLHGKGFYKRPIEDPGTKIVNGQAETVSFTFVDGVTIVKPGETPDPQGLPVSCTAIVLAKVNSGQAFISDDHDFVYSDYDVTIERVLKADAGKSMQEGDDLTAWVHGGSIRFPSGHVKHFLLDGKGFPRIGSEYIFFLGRADSRLTAYEIWTGYEIRNGSVFPLNIANDQFENASENEFIVNIQNALRARSGGN
jgi:hypothetical protein